MGDSPMRRRTLLSMVMSHRSLTRPILFSPPITLSSPTGGELSRPATGTRTPTHLSATAFLAASADVIDELESSLSVAATMGCVQSILAGVDRRGRLQRPRRKGKDGENFMMFLPCSCLPCRTSSVGRLLPLATLDLLLVAFSGQFTRFWGEYELVDNTVCDARKLIFLGRKLHSRNMNILVS